MLLISGRGDILHFDNYRLHVLDSGSELEFFRSQKHSGDKNQGNDQGQLNGLLVFQPEIKSGVFTPHDRTPFQLNITCADSLLAQYFGQERII
jgi:hypothetical protein